MVLHGEIWTWGEVEGLLVDGGAAEVVYDLVHWVVVGGSGLAAGVGGDLR